MTTFLDMDIFDLDPNMANQDLPAHTDKQWDVVKRFFTKGWFGRVWIIQEFLLAREVVFFCGSRQIDWRHLLAVCTGYGPTATIGIQACYSFQELTTSPRTCMLKETPSGSLF